MIAALPGFSESYKELMQKLVCSTESRECMLHRCSNCPGIDQLRTFLEGLFDSADNDSDDIVAYKQWTHDGQSKLQSVTETVSDFINTLCSRADKVTDHHFTAKAQSTYLRQLKESLVPGTAIVLLDFAENYSFVCQDAVQGFHWETSQATLHPFVIYYRKPKPDSQPDCTGISCESMCIISDDREHVTGTVHAFIEIMMQFLKEMIPDLNKVIYFSDGAAAQYKNCKNFKNLCLHQSDFGVEAEWNFFATSHGKSPCDGVGGTVKRLVARHSLQAINTGQILTPVQMYEWAKANIEGINFFFADKDDVSRHRDTLSGRFESIQTVQGTRSHHRFIPISCNKLKLYRLSCDDFGTTVSVSHEPEFFAVNSECLHPGQFVCVTYDKDWYIGLITERSDEQKDILVKFMSRTRGNMFLWPRRDDICWVPFTNVLCCMSAPTLCGSTARQYSYSDEQVLKCDKLFANHSDT